MEANDALAARSINQTIRPTTNKRKTLPSHSNENSNNSAIWNVESRNTPKDSFAMPAPEALVALGSYGRAGGYVNSKRARKMSAFMPMRGRKDGRDASRRQPFGASQLELANLAALGRELEPSGELSVVRLTGRPLFAELDGRPAVPRQFMEQLEQMALRRLPTTGSGQPAGNPVGTIETKYRRAFHPMRGKKSDPQLGVGGDDESEAEAGDFIQELTSELFD